jgi:hypothetical protein
MKRLIRLGVVLLFAVGVTSTTATASERVRPTVFAMLSNQAKADTTLLVSAEAEVTRLYALIDVDLIWLTRVPGPDTRLHIICLVTWEPSENKVSRSVLGYTPTSPGHRGILGYVFLRRVEQASQRFKARVDNVLAVSIAHELGHMRLPDGSHSKTGLMQAPWDSTHFRSASAGLLLFSEETAVLIRRGLAHQEVRGQPEDQVTVTWSPEPCRRNAVRSHLLQRKPSRQVEREAA